MDLTLNDVVQAAERRDQQVQFVPLRHDAQPLRVEVRAGEHGLPESLLVANGEERVFTLGSSATAFCESIGVPRQFLARAPEDLARLNLTRMLEERLRRPMGLWTEDGEVRSLVSSDEALRVPLTPVVETMVESLGAVDPVIHAVRSGVSGVSGELLMAEFEGGAHVPGDLTGGGVQFSFSDGVSGTASFVRGFLLRLVCSNGLTVRDAVAGAAQWSDAALPRVQELVRMHVPQIIGHLGGAAEAFYALADQRVENPALAIAALRREGIPARVLRDVAARWQAEHPENVFGLVNALTWVSSHREDLTPRVLDVVERAASAATFVTTERCPHCSRVV